MNHKLVGPRVESRSGLEASDIGPMTKFSLGVASHPLHGPNVIQPHFALLITPQLLDSGLEHTVMKRSRVDTG